MIGVRLRRNRYLIAQRPPRFVINIKDDWDVHRNCRLNNPKIVKIINFIVPITYNILSSEILLKILLYNYVYVA